MEKINGSQYTAGIKIIIFFLIVIFSISSNAKIIPIKTFPSTEIEIISPNGNEIWGTNTVHEIKWSVEGIDNIKINYTTDKGNTFLLVIIVTVLFS